MGLFGTLTGADAANKQANGLAQKTAAQQAAALNELTPEAFRDFLNFFMPFLNAQSAPAQQAALRGAKTSAGRSGSSFAGLSSALQAGIPGQFAASNLSSALRTTGQVQGARAGIISGTPIVPNSAGRSGISDTVDIALQLYTAGLASTGATKGGSKGTSGGGSPNPLGGFDLGGGRVGL